MSRTKQRLINYHSSGNTRLDSTAYSDVEFGEIVVMHNSEMPLLGIKTNGGNGSANGFAWFISSAAVYNTITAITSGDLSQLQADVKSISGYVETLSGSVVNDYALSSVTHNEILAVSGKLNSLSSSTESIQTNLSNNLNTLSANVVTYVNNQVSSVYKVKGSVANITELNAITGQTEGDVYNVVSASGTPGTSDYIPAGTNYVWVGEQGNGYWDSLGGTINLDSYADATEFNNLKNDFNTLKGNFSGFSGHVLTDYATSSSTYNAIHGVSESVLSLSSSVKTFQETTVPSTYLTKSDASATYLTITSATSKFTEIDGLLEGLSEDLSGVSGVAKTAIQSYILDTITATTGGNLSQQSGAKAIYESNVAKLDLSGLIIDCGDF